MDVVAILRSQDGVISRRQAARAGLSPDAVDRRLASGQWRRLHSCVYLATDHRLTDRARVRAAWLWAGPNAVLVGRAAGFWWRLVPSAPSVIGLAIGRRGRRPSSAGVSVARRDIADEDSVELDGIPTTSLALTTIEVAVATGGSAGSRVVDRVLQQDLTWRQLYRCYCRHLGRRGWKDAAGLLGAAADRAASEAERRLVKLLRQGAVSGWRVDVEVVLGGVGYRLDLTFVRERVAVEVDGWAWHVDVDRFRADRRRQNALVLAGWTVLRFTWADLAERPQAVVAEIRAALAARSARRLPA